MRENSAQTPSVDPSSESQTRSRYADLAWSLLLFALPLVVFAPAVHFDFINLDDPLYIVDNPRVNSGLSWENIRWAFTTAHENWWLPLLFLSFMLDIEIFGPGPFGHHLVNLLLHATNTVLLFWALYRMTRARGPSAFVAALFAVHPLRVEAVAWITSRKDCLSGLFYMLCLLLYVGYARQPSRRRLAVIFAMMLLGLMSKAILITLPPVLLLVDYWPLRRIRVGLWPSTWRDWKPLFREKLPLFGLALVFVLINLYTHTSGRGAQTLAPLLVRICLMPINYLQYLFKILWPARLAVVYPERDIVNVPLLGIALVLLGGLSWWFLRQADRRPYLIIGWLWFFIVLLPVIRGIRMGLAAYADRFTYLPAIGLFVILAWAARDLAARLRARPAVLAAAAAAVTLTAAAQTRAYLAHWRNTETLFRHTLSVTGPNLIINVNYAALYYQRGRYEKARDLLLQALAIDPNHPRTLMGLGLCMEKLGHPDLAQKLFARSLVHAHAFPDVLETLGDIHAKAERYADAARVYRELLRRSPRNLRARYNLGVALIYLGQPEQALEQLQQVLAGDSTHHRAWFFAGQASFLLGRFEDAARYFQRAVELKPARAEYLSAWAQALFKLGRSAEALTTMRRALAAAPESPEVLNNLAWMLATDREQARPDEAVQYARKASELLKQPDPAVLDTLSVAYAANGQFDEAIRTAEEARALAQQQKMTALVEKISARLERFRAREPWRE